MTTSHKLPHLHSFVDQPLLFITAVTYERTPILDYKTVSDCLTEIWRSSPECDGWFVGDYVLMPDHVHLFARSAKEAKPLSQWVQTWKSLSSRRLSEKIQTSTDFWQRNYFDRFLRSKEDYSEKCAYVAMNPVRKNLCVTPEDWKWKGRLTELRF